MGKTGRITISAMISATTIACSSLVLPVTLCSANPCTITVSNSRSLPKLTITVPSIRIQHIEDNGNTADDTLDADADTGNTGNSNSISVRNSERNIGRQQNDSANDSVIVSNDNAATPDDDNGISIYESEPDENDTIDSGIGSSELIVTH